MAIIKDEKDYEKKEKTASMVQLHAFKEHISLTIDDLMLEILAVNNRTQSRKIIEAIQIRAHKPTLNNNKGIDIIVE